MSVDGHSGVLSARGFELFRIKSLLRQHVCHRERAWNCVAANGNELAQEGTALLAPRSAATRFDRQLLPERPDKHTLNVWSSARVQPVRSVCGGCRCNQLAVTRRARALHRAWPRKPVERKFRRDFALRFVGHLICSAKVQVDVVAKPAMTRI